jgi:hypothetical protein
MDVFECAGCAGELLPLGPLGRFVWMRCRACGLQQSRDRDAYDDAIDAAEAA